MRFNVNASQDQHVQRARDTQTNTYMCLLNMMKSEIILFLSTHTDFFFVQSISLVCKYPVFSIDDAFFKRSFIKSRHTVEIYDNEKTSFVQRTNPIFD